MKTIIKLLFAIALVLVNVQVAKSADAVTMFTVGLISVALVGGLVMAKSMSQLMTLNVVTDVKVWRDYIIEKIRKVNDFLYKSVDDSRYVLGGAVVYIPQAGADPVVEINANTYPGVAVRRTDSDINYALDSYRTVPSHIPWAELQTISYDKIDSVVGAHGDVLAEAVADNMLNKWAPTDAGHIVPTTGTTYVSAPITGQTSNRKGLTSADVAKARTILNSEGVPMNGRVAVIDGAMEESLYMSLSDTQMNAFQQFADNKAGIIGRLHGFDFYVRGTSLVYATGTNTPKAYGAAVAATDNLASLFWHPNFVARAVGEIKPFQDMDNPLYYGDIWSMIMRAGGRKLREDNKGVVAVVQAATT